MGPARRTAPCSQNCSLLYNDIAAAYQNALVWNNAGEIMRDYSSFNYAQLESMMRSVFLLSNSQFPAHANEQCVQHAWANWDLCNMASMLTIGIMNVVPFLYPGGRDQGRTQLGVGELGAFCEMAWNQGYDLYGYADNRFMQGAEYVASYNLGNDVPYTTYNWQSSGTGNCSIEAQTAISSDSRGIGRPIWEMLYNHYAIRMGLDVPNITAAAAAVRPEGGGGQGGDTVSGAFDQLGFGTLTYTLEATS